MKQITSLSHTDSQTRNSKAMDSNAMDFHSATGKLEYTLTNDFLFKSLLQKNRKVLKALVASLMRLKIEEITSIEITNPMELGNSARDKTFNLDIRLILNGHTVINLEMQVLNKGFWPERSIGYLARSFDNLKRGEDYSQTKSVVHIGFLDFDLPDIPPEFYSTYKLLNVKNQAKYSDKFTLSVVNLKHIDLATEEDRKYHIDKWAALFKATTWEEIKMIAGKDEYLNEASSELFKRLADLAVQEECEAREQYYKERQYLVELKQEVAESKKELTESKKELTESRKELTESRKELTESRKELTESRKELTESRKELTENRKELTENRKELAENKIELAKRNETIAKKDEAINTLNDENLRLRKLLEQNNISISF